MNTRVNVHGIGLAAGLLSGALVALILAGCGSGGGGKSGQEGGTGNCSATGTPGASMSWDDDGVFVCAISAYVTETSTATLDLVNVTGSTASLGVSFGVTTPGTPIAGPYDCTVSTASQVSFNYQQGATPTFAQSCAVTIDSAPADGGTRVTGTFSGVFPLASGGTKTISNGVFAATAVIAAQ